MMLYSAKKKTLLLVWHSRTGASQQAMQAAYDAAQAAIRALDSTDHAQVRSLTAAEATVQDFLLADALLFCAPENLASLSGMMKECFDRLYYPLLDQLNGRPYSAIICAGTDGQSALTQLQRICTGWRLQQSCEPLILLTDASSSADILAPKQLSAAQLASAAHCGESLAALLCL